MMMTIDKKNIIQGLKERFAVVVFTKSDGSERKMTCTLMEELLPEVDASKPKKARAENDDVVAAFDVDKQAWRSFRLDSVKQITFV